MSDQPLKTPIEDLRKQALEIIEAEHGIHAVDITFRDFFVCPWIDLDKLNRTEMEKFTADLLKKLGK